MRADLIPQHHHDALMVDSFTPSMVLLMSSQEELLQQVYGPDFSMKNRVHRAVISDHSLLAMISMVCAAHEAMTAALEMCPEIAGITEFTHAHEMTGAIHSVAIQGFDIVGED